MSLQRTIEATDIQVVSTESTPAYVSIFTEYELVIDLIAHGVHKMQLCY
jgi:hypothetical protein